MDDCPNDSHACQSEMNKWVMFTKMGRSMNHSCDPNCWLGFDGTNWFFGAFKDIKEGDELNFDYAMGNYTVDHFPECLCGSPQCRKVINGYKNLPL
jgi:SET domain-containing protein